MREWSFLRPVRQQTAEEESESEDGIAMRAGIHDFLFHQPGNLTLHAFGFSQIRRVAIGFFQRYDLLAIRAFRHGWSIPPQGGPSSPTMPPVPAEDREPSLGIT